MPKKKSSTKKGRKNVSVPLTPEEYRTLSTISDREARSLGEQVRVMIQPALQKI